jgi:hypothetical protein
MFGLHGFDVLVAQALAAVRSKLALLAADYFARL